MNGINTLIEQLQSEALWQRICAEAELCAAGHPAVARLSAVVIDDGQPFEARWRAAMALGEIGSADGVSALMQARRDKVLDMRQSAIWALGRIRDQEVFEALVEIFRDPQEEEQLRFVTASALVHIDRQQAIPLLQQALNESQEAQRRAASAVLATLAEQERHT